MRVSPSSPFAQYLARLTLQVRTAFLGIIWTMCAQYAKFLKMAKESRWRHPVPSLNYIETSTLWVQQSTSRNGELIVDV